MLNEPPLNCVLLPQSPYIVFSLLLTGGVIGQEEGLYEELPAGVAVMGPSQSPPPLPPRSPPPLPSRAWRINGESEMCDMYTM